MLHPLYSFYQNRGFTMAYKSAKAESQKKMKEAKQVGKLAHAKGKKARTALALLPGQIKAGANRTFISAKAKAKNQTVSKREIRKRQTMNVGVGALHKEERRDRRNRGSAVAEQAMNRQKSRRQSSGRGFNVSGRRGGRGGRGDGYGRPGLIPTRDRDQPTATDQPRPDRLVLPRSQYPPSSSPPPRPVTCKREASMSPAPVGEEAVVVASDTKFMAL